MRNQRGVSLIEIMVVLAIVAILATMAYSLRSWADKNKVEAEIKELYVDLMSFRLAAIHKNRTHFVSVTATQYTVNEDTNPVPDGDRALQVADALVKTQAVPLTLNWSADANLLAFGANGVISDAVGVIPDADAIYITPGVSADYDCLQITSTKISLGRMNGADCDPN